MIKLLAIDMVHRAVTYQEGLNVDPLPFQPYGSCRSGGLYYTTLEHLPRWYRFDWPLIADVTIPDGARVYAEPCGTKWKADRLVLSNIRSLRQFFAGLEEHAVCRMLAGNGWMLDQVPNPSVDMCLAAVRQNGLALCYVEDQTEEICMTAVQQNPYALQHVDKQTEAICHAAVAQNRKARCYVKIPFP